MLRHILGASLLALVPFSLLAGRLPAQDSFAPGLAAGTQVPVGPFDAYATLPDGTRIVCDGVAIDHVDASGGLIAHLGGYPAYVFPSFVLPSLDHQFALVGESSNGTIVRVELSGAPQSPVATLAYNYDAIWEDATHAFVSADVSGGFQNQILRLDIQTGSSTLVAQLTGPSGPLARRARTGELYFGLLDLALPGNNAVRSYSAAQLAGALPMGVSDSALFAGGLDSVSALRIDERYDVAGLDFWRLFVAISPFGTPSVIADFTPAGTRQADLVSSVDSISNLELAQGSGPGSFAPWQPDLGERLSYRGTYYCWPSCSTASIRTVEPRRPQASISGPGLGNPLGGPVTVALTGCVPNASVLLLVGPQSLYNPTEQTHTHPDGFLWHTGLAWSPLRRLVTLPTDSLGNASFGYVHNGSLNGTHAFQALVKDAGGLYVGSSTCVLN